MYTDADLVRAEKQKKERLLCSFSVLAVALSMMTVGISMRNHALATYGAAAIACLFYAVLELKALPYARYASYVRDIKEGLSRETDAKFVRISDAPRMNNGVMFYDFFVRDGAEVDEDNERLFYFDADKQLPTFQPGQQLHITSFGNYITGIESNGQKVC